GNPTTVLDGSGEQSIDGLDARLQFRVGYHESRPVAIDLLVDTDPASTAAVLLFHLHGGRLSELERADRHHVDRLIGAKMRPLLERGAVEEDHGLEAKERVEITNLPGAYDFAPVGNENRRGRLSSTLVKIGRKEIEAIRFQAECRVGDAALANQNDLLAAAKGSDDGGPFFQGGAIREPGHDVECRTQNAERRMKKESRVGS